MLSNTSQGRNIAGYCNPQVDQLINEAFRGINEGKNIELCRKAIEIVWRDAIWIFLYA